MSPLVDQCATNPEDTFDGMIGQSAPMRELFRRIALVASLDERVLLIGETGTGKELVARSIHHRSARAGGPLVAVNCSAVPTHLFESEFFGHERGAFTDAHEARPGHFERAHGGTLFLDEIGDLALDAQAKLLRVLEQREVQRLGGRRPAFVDTRVIAATNINLVDATNRGAFRKDLYWRLGKVVLRIPPVRERSEDIALIVEASFQRLRNELRRPHLELSEPTRLALLSHSWPGNVRQVEHVMYQAILTTKGPHVEVSDLDWGGRTAGAGGVLLDTVLPEGVTLTEGITDLCALLEQNWIRNALVTAQGNQTAAARRLGINPRTLHTKMLRYGLRADFSGRPDQPSS